MPKKILVTITGTYIPNPESYQGETDIEKMMEVDEELYNRGHADIEEVVSWIDDATATFEIVEYDD